MSQSEGNAVPTTREGCTGLVNPGDRHPLRGTACLVKGFLQFLEGFINAIVDQGEVKVVSVLAADGLRVLLQLLQGLRLQRREKEPPMMWVAAR